MEEEGARNVEGLAGGHDPLQEDDDDDVYERGTDWPGPIAKRGDVGLETPVGEPLCEPLVGEERCWT